MDIQTYILKRLNLLPNINIATHYSYSYEKSSNYHIIEISPESVRRGDDAYMNWEYETYSEFGNLFPNDDILITEPLPVNNNQVIALNIIQQELENEININISKWIDVNNDKNECNGQRFRRKSNLRSC